MDAAAAIAMSVGAYKTQLLFDKMKGQAAAGANGGKDEFNLRANTAIEGLNVAFYLADEYIDINWGGSAQTDLIGRQETGDPMNGFLFYADPSNEGPHQFRGSPSRDFSPPPTWSNCSVILPSARAMSRNVGPL